MIPTPGVMFNRAKYDARMSSSFREVKAFARTQGCPDRTLLLIDLQCTQGLSNSVLGFATPLIFKTIYSNFTWVERSPSEFLGLYMFPSPPIKSSVSFIFPVFALVQGS